MAIALRIDAISVTAGVTTVQYTFGRTPLPASSTRVGFIGVIDDDMESKDLVEFLLSAIATYRRLRNIPVANLVGKTITINLANLANVMTVS
jgi:hypothetical protein